ncbi:MAG: ankyrin repeat domain-containing protein [Treponema sp.]|nr:ankyrin repeat domain-containing protein [Treponema sp.]
MKKASFIISLTSVMSVFLALLIGCISNPKENPPEEAPAPRTNTVTGTPANTAPDIWTLLQNRDSSARGYFLGEVDVNAKDSTGRTPLHYAADARDSQLASFFISLGANVNALDSRRQSPLGISIEQNDIVTARIIAAAGADIHLGLNNTTAASLALERNNTIFSSILTPANIATYDNTGKTVLHLASIAGNVQAVHDILALIPSSSAVINKNDINEKNALDYAFERTDSKKHMETAELLILAGAYSENPIFQYMGPAVRSANYNIRRGDGLAPIHFAVIDDYTGLIEYLLDKNIDLDVKSASGATALHEAVRKGNVSVVSMLLAKGADVNSRDARGNTPLHTGVPSEVHKEIVTMLIGKGADPNLRDEYGETPLHIAIILNRSLDVIQALLNGGSDVYIRNIEGKTPLYLAVQERRNSLIPVLITSGSEIFSADNSGLTPFDIAIKSDNNTFFQLITNETIIQRDSKGNTVIHASVINRGNPEHLSRILDSGALIDARNRDGDTALHISVRTNQRENGEFLISSGANIFALNGTGDSPLYIALSSSPMRQWIINSDTLIAKDGLGNTILHYAAEWNLNNAIPLIIRSGIHANAVNAAGQTPLFMAIRTDNTSTIRTLIENNANLNARDNQGTSALHAAVRWNALNSVAYLIAAGIDINAHSLNGNTPLHDAVTLGAIDVETLLITLGANLEVRNTEGNTPLMEAVRSAAVSSAEKLLRGGADSSTRNTRGDTPLHIAVSIESHDLVQMLLKTGVSIHARNTRNRTPFQISLSVSLQMVSSLLTDNRINVPDDMGNSILHIAIQERAPDNIIRSIISQGARINSVDSNGKTPLRIAIDTEAWESAKILAESGADPFITAVDNKTPGEISFEKGSICINALFSGRLINSSDNSGNTILHIAARYGTPEYINLLLELGADKSAKNIASESAYDIALRWNRRDNAEILRNL